MADKKQQLKELMKLHYGFKNFRGGQDRAVTCALAGKSCVVIMPTGGGKSLCYQLPALVLDGVTFVVSPLIALMKDQVDGLQRIGIPATFVNSSISPQDTAERLAGVREGKYKLLYVAPERFYNQEFINALKDIKVSLFAVDEAHCISQWGHDFRPSYLKLKQAVELAGHPPVMALTATATPEVRKDIIKQLDLKDSEVIVTGFARPNLQFGVLHANEARKPGLALDAVTSAPEGSGIIYAGTRQRVDNLVQFLLENDIEAAAYHAGMEPEDRKWVQNQFMRNKVRVIVATNAFGLGIDKPDIRFVVHYDMPGTVEAYYQEAGRAGRDGQASFCLLMYNSRDRALHEFFIKGDNPPPSLIREIYDLLLSYDSDRIMITYAEIMENLSDNAPDMAVGTGLKLLEKEGYISRAREKQGNAYLRLNKPAAYIMDTISKQAKKQLEVMEKLNDRFGDEAGQGWYFVPNEVAEIISVKKETLMRTVRKLSDEGLLDYRPPFRGTEIQILKRVRPRELKFDEEAMRDKQQAAYKKLDKIEDYVYDFGCRQKFILDYFGDREATACGKCDTCLTGAAISAKPRSAKASRNIAKEKYYGGKQFHRPKDDDDGYTVAAPDKGNGLITKLTQLETLELYNKGLSLQEITDQRGLTTGTIAGHIVFLVEKGILAKKEIDKLVPKKTQTRIKEAADKVGREKLRPIYEELGGEVGYDEIKLFLAK